MRPPFSHRPKNESRQNQKQNLSNERSYQKITKTPKNTHVKKLHPQELFTFKNIKEQGLTIKELI